MRSEYHSTLDQLLGLPVDDARSLVQNKHRMPAAIAQENGRPWITTDNIQVLFNVEQGRVVGAELDGHRVGKW